MSTTRDAGARWAWVGLGFFLVLPSTAPVQKYLGLLGVAGYAVSTYLLLALAARKRTTVERLLCAITERQAIVAIASTFLLLITAFLLIFPLADSGVLGGGSDADDALDLATVELLHGRYPYYERTYLGNQLSPLPGALLLAAPFVVLGNGAWQNFFWLLAFVVVMKGFLGGWRTALCLLWLILGLAPIVLNWLVIGVDYVANSLYVLVLALWATGAIMPSSAGDPAFGPSHAVDRQAVHHATVWSTGSLRVPWSLAIPAVALGIGLSSRANFLLLVPLVCAALARRSGWKTAIACTAITGLAFAIVTLPFFLYDPAGFSPLHAREKLDQFDPILPHSALLITGASGIAALALAWRHRRCMTPDLLLVDCAVVLVIPALAGTVLSMIRSARPDFGFALYASFALFFGATGCFGYVARAWQADPRHGAPQGASPNSLE